VTWGDTHFVHAGAPFGDEPDDHRFLGAGDEAEAQGGRPLQDNSAGLGDGGGLQVFHDGSFVRRRLVHVTGIKSIGPLRIKV
jgi:hypothetical protein